MQRREFFQKMFLGICAFPFLAKWGQRAARAADACPATGPAGQKLVDPAAANAKRLNFVMDNSTSKHAKYKTGDECRGCSFYQAAKAKEQWAPCTMLGNNFVPACGWCQSYKGKVKA